LKPLDSFNFDVRKCIAELDELEKLLKQAELREFQDILPFFKKNLHLSAFIASYVAEILRFDTIKHEFTFFGDFRVDLQQIPIQPATKGTTSKAQNRSHNDETN